MMKNFNVHTLIINLLRDGIHLIEGMTYKDKESQIVQIFEECFEFLKNFCKNDNRINKKLLYNQREFFFKFMNFIEVGQSELIIEIYKDNFRAIQEIQQSTIMLFINKIIHPSRNRGFGGHHERYLEFLEKIISFKKSTIKQNLKKILNVILDKSNKFYDILYMKPNPYKKI